MNVCIIGVPFQQSVYAVYHIASSTIKILKMNGLCICCKTMNGYKLMIDQYDFFRAYTNTVITIVIKEADNIQNNQ